MSQHGFTRKKNAPSRTHALAQALLGAKGLHVITNSIDVAKTLATSPDIEVHLLGGKLQTDVPATSGEASVSELGHFHVDYALISPTALSPEHGALD